MSSPDDTTKFEKAKQKVKQHVTKHKTKYLVGSSVVSSSAVTFFLMQRFGTPVDVNQIAHAKNTALLQWQPKINVDQIQETIINMPARADRGHIIVDLATGLPVGSSITEAARNEGMSRRIMREVIRGVRETAPNGKTYADLGENLSEQVRMTSSLV